MNSAEVARLMFARPFRPFRIVLNDGKAHDVIDPIALTVRLKALTIDPLFSHSSCIEWHEVAAVEIIPESQLPQPSSPFFSWPYCQ